MQLAEYVVLLILIAFFYVLYYCVYRQFHPSKIIYYLCSSKPIEVRVGLLLKYVLIGCTVTESKCSRITQHLEFHIARGRLIFKSLVGGVDTIKSCT